MKRFFLYILTVVLLLGSCKKFIDVNNNPNSPTDVQESLILAPVELAISHRLVAGGTGPTLSPVISPVLVQHYTQTVCLNQPVPNHGTYQLVSSEVDESWATLYTSCLQNLKKMNTKAEASGNFNYAGIAKILTAFCLGVTTDLWGDVPYSEAFQGNLKFTPKYDAQEDLYKAIQQLLDNGIADINKNAGKIPGKDDNFYNGQMSQWTKLAYTLKARYYIHLTKAPGYTADQQATLALQALQNGMGANGDDLTYKYDGAAGQEIQWYRTFDPVSTLILSAAFVDSLKVRNDPRLSVMVKPAGQTGLYNGRAIGTPGVGSLESYSRPGDFFRAPNATNYIVNYTEALFIKAEATLIKSGFAAAQPIYKQAIETHMAKLGVAVNSPEAVAYLATRGTITAANALQRIMEEKAIANFLSMENFNDWRRTGFPLLQKVPGALSDIPRRLLYPQSERTSNPQPLHTASLTDRVWWDMP